MESDYKLDEVVEIGKAQEVILGGKEIFPTDDLSQGVEASDFEE